MRTTKLIVVGLWFGKNKPDMNVFLDPFVKNINRLSKEGVESNLNGENPLEDTHVFRRTAKLMFGVDLRTKLQV